MNPNAQKLPPALEKFGIPPSRMQSYADSGPFVLLNDNQQPAAKAVISPRKRRLISALRHFANMAFGWSKPKPQLREVNIPVGYCAGFGGRRIKMDNTLDKVPPYIPK